MLRLHGQEFVVRSLEQSLLQGRLHHAYLFAGPPHLGKTTLAVQFAQALNCTGDASPCGECPACARIAKGEHADVRLIGVDPEATEGPRTLIGIGAVRDIIHTAYLRPYEGRKRVFIITEADLLSADAANALLKILEEPPPDVVLILLSNNAEGVLPTVRSRCQTLEFRPLPIEAVARVLREEEGLGEEQAQVLARLSRGCIGWAIGAGRDDALYAGVHQRLEHAVDAIEGGLDARFSYAEELARRFQRDRSTGREDLYLLLRWLRDVLLIQQGLGELIVNLSWKDTLERHAAGLTQAAAAGWAREVIQTIEALERNANPAPRAGSDDAGGPHADAGACRDCATGLARGQLRRCLFLHPGKVHAPLVRQAAVHQVVVGVSPGLPRLFQQAHACLRGGASGLAMVARDAGGHDVLPRVWALHDAGHDVIKGEVFRLLAAVLAGELVSPEHLAA